MGYYESRRRRLSNTNVVNTVNVPVSIVKSSQAIMQPSLNKALNNTQKFLQPASTQNKTSKVIKIDHLLSG